MATSKNSSFGAKTTIAAKTTTAKTTVVKTTTTASAAPASTSSYSTYKASAAAASAAAAAAAAAQRRKETILRLETLQGDLANIEGLIADCQTAIDALELAKWKAWDIGSDVASMKARLMNYDAGYEWMGAGRYDFDQTLGTLDEQLKAYYDYVTITYWEALDSQLTGYKNRMSELKQKQQALTLQINECYQALS